MPAQAAAIRLVDDAGQTLEFTRPPQRIVSLTPHLTELLFAVGAGAQLVGVDSASDYPKAAQALPRVGDYSRINFERILALKPDLVIAWVGGNRAADIHGLNKMGLPVLHTQATRLDDVARLLRLIGQASGHAGQGDAAARDFSARLDALQVRAAPAAAGQRVLSGMGSSADDGGRQRTGSAMRWRCAVRAMYLPTCARLRRWCRARRCCGVRRS